ncbi:MAG: hypothetical protein M1816_001515 [Peltula sp. TS41687]|nr:MAG: hypothetical protein M1816_001515 [Peltula sp. TS41687]
MVNFEASTHRPPTYEELYSSRPSPPDSDSRRSEQDVERQVLLPSEASSSQSPLERRMGNYQPPSAETRRSSEESSVSFMSAASAASSYARIRTEMVEMDIMDEPQNEETGNPSALRTHLNKGLTAITTTITSFQRRIPVRWPSFGSLVAKIPPHIWVLLGFVGRVLMLSLVVFGTYLIMSMILGSDKQSIDRESVREYAQGQADGDRIRRFLKRLTSFDHIAGTQGDYAMAKYVQTVFEREGLEDVGLNEYANQRRSGVILETNPLIIS